MRRFDMNINSNNITKTNMQETTKINNKNTTSTQKRIDFLKNLKTLRMGLNGVNKNLNGYGYKYQDFNEIVREVKNVIKEHDLDIDFVQIPTCKVIGNNTLSVITTTFYNSSGYEYSFDTPIYIEELKSIGVKSQNTWPQLVGSAITYFKRYALVAYLSIESEVDTDASNLDIEQRNNRGQIENNTSNSKDSSASKPSVDVTKAKSIESRVQNKQVVNTGHSKSEVKHNVNMNESISTKYYCYQNLLIASRNMYNFLSDKPFGSLSEINDYLESVKSGDDSKLLEYFNKNKMLKSIEYWCNLIKEYFTKSSRDLSKLEKFNIFMSFDLDKVGNSPLKLFSQLSITKEFQCLFSLT
ncbi:ERF superfamily protein (plasmid) [Borrelia crocidurae DOU]|uniref:ERF superfamily protein n=3 Tax=Borrelia crocidurae TaxID=29520 RepID=W5SR53_9SPIR|nr:ERF superfamily protein [Borrelia crocidurae DOU]